MPSKKIIARALLALAIACTAIVATASVAYADDVGTDKQQLRFCNDDEAGTDSHGGKMKCKKFCLADGVTEVELKVKHLRGGWRSKKFKEETGATEGPCGSGSSEADPFVSDRRIYCMGGIAVDLLKGQPDEDPAYEGAIPAAFVEGEGATCDTLGLAYVPGVWRDGFSDTSYDALLAELAGDLYPLATR